VTDADEFSRLHTTAWHCTWWPTSRCDEWRDLGDRLFRAMTPFRPSLPIPNCPTGVNRWHCPPPDGTTPLPPTPHLILPPNGPRLAVWLWDDSALPVRYHAPDYRATTVEGGTR